MKSTSTITSNIYVFYLLPAAVLSLKSNFPLSFLPSKLILCNYLKSYQIQAFSGDSKILTFARFSCLRDYDFQPWGASAILVSALHSFLETAI